MKRASIIQGANGVSRGFGFVKFALPEDAARAAAILHGSDFHHRRLAVELAMKKGQKPANVPDAPAAKRAAAAAAAAAKAKAKAATPAAAAAAPKEEGKAPLQPEVKVKDGQAQPAKANAPAAAAAAAARKKPAPALVGQHPSNTLLVFNLAAQTTEKQLFKRIKKIQPPSSVKTQVR